MSTPHLLSASRVELARHCVAWLAPDAVWKEQSTYSQKFGSAVHWMLEERLSHGELPSYFEAASRFKLTDRQLGMLCDYIDSWEEWAARRRWLVDAIVGVEVPFAYDPETRTARKLEKGEHREYRGAKEHEVVGTIDALADMGGHDVIIDWKCGGFGLPAPEAHPQTRTNSLSVAMTRGAWGATGALVALRPGGHWYDSHEFNSLELVDIAGEIEEIHERRKLPVVPAPGDWCDKCPAIKSCKATNKGKRKKL